MSTYDDWKTTEPVDPYAEEQERQEREAAEEEDRRQAERRSLVEVYLATNCLCENCTANLIDQLQQI